MKIYLCNVGKINEATIEVKGITVIAGQNDTGKSTVCRTLYSIYESLFHVEDQIIEERTKSIEKELKFLLKSFALSTNTPSDTKEMARIIAQYYRSKDVSGVALITVIQDLLNEFCRQQDIPKKLQKTDAYSNTLKHICNIMSVSDDSIQERIFGQNLLTELGGQICNIFSENSGQIHFENECQKLTVLIEKGGEVEIQCQRNVSPQTRPLYIDDPLVLDDPQSIYMLEKLIYTNYRDHLRNMVLYTEDKKEFLLDEFIAQGKLKRVYEKISLVCDGNIVYRTGTLDVGFKRQNTDKVLDIRNLSAGIKLFAILKFLLKNGEIEQNGLLILDDPEIHLYTEWQLLLAEIIVLLRKDFGLNILVCTHSSPFVRAIQEYSAKYGVASSCKYYLAKTVAKKAEIEDVSDCVEKVHTKSSCHL
ncbi:MAG: ATP-binding protein [Clostridiales bacterium]|nr:ATP-binding protein [Clostridiales bacterium]